MMKRWLCWGVLIGLALSGCGESNSGPPTETVRYGAMTSKVRGLDPMDIGDTTSSGIASNFYDTLYQYHYLKRPYELTPSLAAEMPTISDDGLTYTIKLRDDVVFHDDAAFPDGIGRPLVADDFIYAWKRIANAKNVSKNWWIFDGRIEGLNDYREYTKTVPRGQADDGRPVSGLTALDDHTLQIKLTRPWPQATHMLSHLPTAAVPREAVEHYGDGFANHAVGTGPFVLESWRRGNKLVLAKNPTYREEFYPDQGAPGDAEAGLLADAGKKLPLIDRAEFVIVEEDLPYWLLFMDGKTDRAGIPKDNYDGAITAGKTLTPTMRDKGIRLVTYDDPATFWYGFNMDDPVIGKNLPLRQAMNLALNRQEYLDLFLNNRGTPARGILPPMFADYNPDLLSPDTVYDPERARALVAQAQRVHGGPLPRITLTMGSTDSTARETGQYLIDTMEAIGLDFDVEYVDWPTAQDMVHRKQAQMYAMGWVADIPDSENFLQLFYGPNAAPGSNGMNYRNPVFDALYEEIAVMDPGPDRTAKVREMEEMIIDEMPCLLTNHGTAFVLEYDWVKNYKPHVFGYGLMKYTDIDTDQRYQRVGHYPPPPPRPRPPEVFPTRPSVFAGNIPCAVVVVGGGRQTNNRLTPDP